MRLLRILLGFMLLTAGCVLIVIWFARDREHAKSRETLSPAAVVNAKARLGKKLFYEVKNESITVYGFDAPDWNAVERLLQMKSKEDPDSTNLRILLMKGDVPGIRKELEQALGVSWMVKNRGVEVRYSVTDDLGSPLTICVIEKNPIAALAYLTLLKRNQMIKVDDGLQGGGSGGVSWSENEATGSLSNFIPISVQEELLPGDIMKRDRMRR